MNYKLPCLKATLFSLVWLTALFLPLLAIAEIAPCGYKDMDIVLMLDVTGSSGAEQIWEQKKAIRALADYFKDEDVDTKPRFALGHFNTSATIVQPMTSDYEALKKSLKQVQDVGEGGTLIHTGLKESKKAIESAFGKDRDKIIMLFSDGMTASENKAISLAQEIKVKGINVMAIHYNFAKSTSGVRLMKNVASEPTYKFYMKIFADLADSIIELINVYACQDDLEDSEECFLKNCKPRGDLNSDGFLEHINHEEEF